MNVSGYAYLSGANSHHGIRVLFEERSPSAETDSTFTATNGSYQIALEPGVYDVRYDYAGFASVRRSNVLLLFDTELEATTLMPPLSGELCDPLLPGDYEVVDTITLGARCYLRIPAGTRFFFSGPFPFLVEGQLEALGTEQDSIVFSRRYPTAESRWGGIHFRNASSSGSRMEYCVVERVYVDRGTGVRSRGAISCVHASPRFENSTIRLNSGGFQHQGGGISCSASVSAIVNCDILENEASDGGGIFAASSSVQVLSCLISDNRAFRGGGLYLSDCSATIAGCNVEQNRCESGYGAGIYCDGNVGTNVVNTTVRQNYAYLSSIELVGGDRTRFQRCFVFGNANAQASTVHAENAASTILNCTFAGNTSYGREATVFADGHGFAMKNCIVCLTRSGPGLQASSDSVEISHNAFFSNADGDIAGGPPGIGIVALTNANGDSCDTYYNIFLDPQFADTSSGDYHLTAGSPCIDAGDPGSEHDPDGTVADIGAFYFDQLYASRKGPIAIGPYGLSQNYPNPLNAATRIEFDLPRTGEISLSVYDLLGRKVASLADGSWPAGHHEVAFDARGLPSGVYVYRLAAAGFSDTKKLVVLR